MSGNKLSSLSAEVGALRKLHRLIADGNLLTSIPGDRGAACISPMQWTAAHWELLTMRVLHCIDLSQLIQRAFIQAFNAQLGAYTWSISA